MSGGTAELQKLAHTLDVDTGRLTVVAGLPETDLRALRKQIGEAFFQADKHYFGRLATLSRSLPTAVLAKVTEAALPPLIAARTAELIDPARAAELVGRLSDRYLADVSAAMDPARAPEVIAAIPAARIAKVASELARRDAWVVIGAFVAEVTADALAASVACFDGEQLLRIGYVLDDLTRLDEIGAMLSDEQLDQMLGAAADLELWRELDGIVTHLSGERVVRLASRFAAAGGPMQAAYEQAVSNGRLSASTHELFGG